ncbi:MAG: sigma-70 family RNA polymerase sigma factor, partial [Planctomycetes bacterium]|nr:sigma-70 family RNA polymerase sigma factor [Planctomycetota bacterium]
MSPPKITRDFLQNRQALLGYLFALTRDQLVAEEVFQEVALAILEEASSGRQVDPFLPWAREVARRRVLEYYRKSARAPLSESMIDLVGRSFQENEEAPEQDSRRLVSLRECLQKLPDRARQAIDLRYNVRLGIEAIAQSLS